jgi:hypothetical protein
VNFVKSALIASALAVASSTAVASTIDGTWTFTYFTEGSNWSGTVEANYAPDSYQSILDLSATSAFGHTAGDVSPIANGAQPFAGGQPDDLLFTPADLSSGTFSFGELTTSGFAFATSIGVNYRIFSNPNANGGFNIQQCIGRGCLTQSGTFQVTFNTDTSGTGTGTGTGAGTGTTTVPEPSTIGLLGLALLGLAFLKRKRLV